MVVKGMSRRPGWSGPETENLGGRGLACVRSSLARDPLFFGLYLNYNGFMFCFINTRTVLLGMCLQSPRPVHMKIQMVRVYDRLKTPGLITTTATESHF